MKRKQQAPQTLPSSPGGFSLFSYYYGKFDYISRFHSCCCCVESSLIFIFLPWRSMCFASTNKSYRIRNAPLTEYHENERSRNANWKHLHQQPCSTRSKMKSNKCASKRSNMICSYFHFANWSRCHSGTISILWLLLQSLQYHESAIKIFFLLFFENV